MIAAAVVVAWVALGFVQAWWLLARYPNAADDDPIDRGVTVLVVIVCAPLVALWGAAYGLCWVVGAATSSWSAREPDCPPPVVCDGPPTDYDG